MSGWTRFFLVVLRLVIGWHLLFAGVEKLRKDTWTSEGYLRESYGPLAPTFRRVAGDAVLDRLTLRPLPDDFVLGKELLHEYFPPALAAEWDAYFERFAAHHQLDAQKRELAQAKLEKLKDAAVRWMLEGKKLVRKTSPHGPAIEVERTTPQRVQEYLDKLHQARDLQDHALAAARRSGLADQVQKVTRDLDAARADANRLRRELRADVDQQTAALKEALQTVLTPAQVEKGTPPEPPRNPWRQPERWREWSLLDWNDAVVGYGLTAVGALLLVGLFTRTACVLGACFLLGFYVAAPALLGAPEALRAEGYPFVNKNVVEAVALLALATTRSGRWAGLDAFVYWLNPFRWGRGEPAR